jgi:ligand-binding sensor domain-containing protein/signal transduction histidine kinase
MKVYFHILLLIIGNSTMTIVDAQEFSQDLIPIFKNLTINDGLSNNEVKQIVQDSAGFIWLATGSGVDRYDGYNCQVFRPAVDQPSELERLAWRPVKLVIDKSNRFFMGSDFAGLQMYDPSKNELCHFTTENSGLPDNDIHTMLLDKVNNLWIGTQGGLCRLNTATKKIDRPFELKQSINKLSIDDDQNFWVAFSDGGLIQIRDGRIRTSKKLNETVIHDIFAVNPDTLLLATESGVLSYHFASDSFFTLLTGQNNSSFSTVYLDNYKNIWAGTYHHGLFYYNRGDKRTYQFRHETGNRQSLVSDHIASLFGDEQGNLWVGTYGDGVSIISTTLDQIKVHYNRSVTQGGGNSVTQILHTAKGEIWSHNNQTLTHIPNSTAPHKDYQLPQDLPCNRQIQVITDYLEGLLIATRCDLIKWSPDQPDHYESILGQFPKIPKNQIISLNYQQPKLYIGTSAIGSEEGLWVVDLHANTFQQFKEEDGPSAIVGNQVKTTLRSSHGDLWVGTWDDLNLYRPQYGFIAVESILDNCDCLRGGSSVISVYEDHQGLIWFGRIDDGGLVVIDPITLANNCFRTENGLPDNSVTSIFQDYQNNIWIGTYQGAAKIAYPKDPFAHQNLDLAIVGITEGLPNATLWNGSVSQKKDRIYFGTRDGMIEIDANKVKLNREAPKTILSSFRRLNNMSPGTLWQTSELTKMIRLRPNDKVITIDFSAVNFYHSEAMDYAYRFSNFDSNWIDLGHQHSITFANLAAGQYNFQVKSRLTNSAWGEAAKLHLLLIPPLYQRWWFILLVIMLSLYLVYAIQQYRIQQLKNIQQIREQISRDLHDDIGSALTNIEIMSGLAAREESKGKPTLQRILKTAKSSNESLHQIVWNMNPANDQLSNMIPFLAEHAARLLEEININLVIHDETEGTSMKIEVAKRKDLLLAFKEALTNIVKHAEATKVVVYFQHAEKMFQIVIADNGRGLMVPLTKQGNGIANMKERLNKWGGKVDFSSPSEGGLRVVIKLPIP